MRAVHVCVALNRPAATSQHTAEDVDRLRAATHLRAAGVKQQQRHRKKNTRSRHGIALRHPGHRHSVALH